jgi:hypothetical protein
VATLNITNLKQVETRLRQRIIKALRSKRIRELIGDTVVKAIKERKDFGAPKESTEKQRRYLERYNSTDPAYDRNKINAVFTGELLADLEKNVRLVSKKGSVSFEIAQSDKRHKKYQGKTKKVGSRSKYSEIQKGLEDLGYNYLFVDDKAVDELIDLIRQELLKEIAS